MLALNYIEFTCDLYKMLCIPFESMKKIITELQVELLQNKLNLEWKSVEVELLITLQSTDCDQIDFCLNIFF
jgi:hypothetical protein